VTFKAKLPVDETPVRLSAVRLDAPVHPVVAASNEGFVTRFVSVQFPEAARCGVLFVLVVI
jgi:hypothetical protein